MGTLKVLGSKCIGQKTKKECERLSDWIEINRWLTMTDYSCKKASEQSVPKMITETVQYTSASTSYTRKLAYVDKKFC